jgi:hypothetical protein
MNTHTHKLTHTYTHTQPHTQIHKHTLTGTFAWVSLATGVSSKAGAVAMMVLASLSTAFSDVVVDSIVVERARGEEQVSWSHTNQ